MGKFLSKPDKISRKYLEKNSKSKLFQSPIIQDQMATDGEIFV